MSDVTTIVLRMPDNALERKAFSQVLERLRPYQTAMSLEDEMTILELIESDTRFDPDIAEDARRKAAALHRKMTPA